MDETHIRLILASKVQQDRMVFYHPELYRSFCIQMTTKTLLV